MSERTGKTASYDTPHSFSVNADDATPMVKQFLNVKENYPGVILFYRMGDFYETFFEDALITAKSLEITLTGRDAGKLGRIPMAGVPVKAAEAYLTRLLNHNFKVAICEQVEDPDTIKGAQKLMERKVVRVLSPGTVTEQSLLTPDENNFLAAIVTDNKHPGRWGLAFCDVTTGAFFATGLDFDQLLSELDRIRPVEVLVPGRIKKAKPGEGFDEVAPDAPAEITANHPCTAVPALALDTTHTEGLLRELLAVHSLEAYGLADWPLAKQAAGMIGWTVNNHFIEDTPVFDGIKPYRLDRTVAMNTATRQNLELLATVRSHQYAGSLLSILNKTATSMGGRLLRQWISQPLTHLPEINSRLDGVGELINHPNIREGIRRLLPDVYDIERLGAKLANLTVLPRDLIALKHSARRLPELSSLLKPLGSFYMTRLHEFPPGLFKMTALIDQAIADTPATSLTEGGIIRAGYHQELDQIRDLVENQERWLADYEAKERERTGIKNLKVSFNNAFGYYIEVSRANSGLVPESYARKQTLTNAERYTTDELKTFEAQVLDAQGRQYDLEYRLYADLRQQLQAYAKTVTECAQRVAALDVLQSLATVAVEQGYTRPVVDESHELVIHEGRHPVVEKTLPFGRFVANDIRLSSAEKEYQIPQLMIITGPNMAGKSTYMRQVALITLMAQMGSFVSASYARIGLVDGIYTRIGAVDDLASGQSTFMVEMNETAQILHGATRRSLVLLDEVGRGTSTYDGVAIAWGVSEYLVSKIGCRTLFATHYHELNTLEETHPKIANYRICVSENDGDIEFLHRVEPGAAQKSYGIQVARMAGIPREVVSRATGIMNTMQKKDLAVTEKQALTGQAEDTPQLSLF